MRLYEVTNVTNAQRNAAKTIMQFTAGAGQPCIIRRTLVSVELATGFQLECEWQVIATPTGGNDQDSRGASIIQKLDFGDPAAGFSVKGDLSAEPVGWGTDVRGRSRQESRLGWRYPFLDAESDEGLEVLSAEVWGLRIINASFTLTHITTNLLVEERGLGV